MIRLGLVRLEQFDLRQAIEAFRKAIETQGEYVEAYNNCGGALAQTGDRSGAIGMFRESDPGRTLLRQRPPESG